MVMSDIHANQVALEAVLSAAGQYDAVWNLGDTVGYGPRPNECIDIVKSLDPEVNLAGNHDRASTGDLSVEEFNPVARLATEWTHQQLTPEGIEYLRSLPTTSQVGGFMQVHGSPRHPVWEYVTQPQIARENFQLFDQQACFVGHSHLQFYWSESMASDGRQAAVPTNGERLVFGDERFIINPGSVGQPRDHNPLAAFAMLDTVSAELTFRRALYDVVETQTQMEQADLPPPLIARLTVGV